jgi:hypothetical protein
LESLVGASASSPLSNDLLLFLVTRRLFGLLPALEMLFRFLFAEGGIPELSTISFACKSFSSIGYLDVEANSSSVGLSLLFKRIDYEPGCCPIHLLALLFFAKITLIIPQRHLLPIDIRPSLPFYFFWIAASATL